MRRVQSATHADLHEANGRDRYLPDALLGALIVVLSNVVVLYPTWRAVA